MIPRPEVWWKDQSDFCAVPDPTGFNYTIEPHLWRFYGYEDESGKETWYCERCRKIEKRWAPLP